MIEANLGRGVHECSAWKRHSEVDLSPHNTKDGTRVTAYRSPRHCMLEIIPVGTVLLINQPLNGSNPNFLRRLGRLAGHGERCAIVAPENPSVPHKISQNAPPGCSWPEIFAELAFRNEPIFRPKFAKQNQNCRAQTSKCQPEYIGVPDRKRWCSQLESLDVIFSSKHPIC